ncbi:condensation domain-containing protein, partial [Chryseobacterium sp. JV558]|uniref:condensation domain-containing protein n=1 Tax=Chryseobacterium sp. JV558 TaxID=2663236 RepID=UPI00299D39AF
MELNELFKTLRENKINISLHGENLKVGSDAPDIDVLLLEKIRENKSQIIDYLKTNISHKYEQIPLAPAADAYPLSSAQMRLWILSQFEGGNTAYIIPTTYTLKGILNIEHFKRSLLSIVSRHEILRTVFREDQNQDIKQYILSLESMDIEINYKDLRDDESRDEKVKKYIHEESVIPFNLHAGPLFRLGLFHLSDDYYVFSCVMHHIISDAWSIQVMIRELFLTYNALTKNEIIPLTPLKVQYKDYSIWQHSYKLSENMAASKAYWLSQFSGDLPILDAFADNARPKEKTYNGALYHKIFDQKLSKGLKEIIRSEGGTLFMGLTGLLKVLLFRYTNQSDITLGTPIARRNHPDLKDQIGFYINTLALRTKFDGEDSFKVLLNKVKTVTIASYEHQDYPFDELVEELNLFRDTSRNPLFDIMISLQNVDIGSHNTRAKEIEGLKIESYESAFLGSMFDLTFDFGEVSGELYLSVNYNTDIYHSSTIERMCGHL